MATSLEPPGGPDPAVPDYFLMRQGQNDMLLQGEKSGQFLYCGRVAESGAPWVAEEALP